MFADQYSLAPSEEGVIYVSKHVENGEFDGCQRHPDCQTLSLIVVLIDGGGRDQIFDVARVFSDKERSEALQEHRVEDFHLLRVRDRNTLVPVPGANATNVLLLAQEQFDRLNNHRGGKQRLFEDGFAQDGVQLLLLSACRRP